MRINEVVKLTGFSKRTLYYYIEEQLIFPRVNPDNGYYIFSEEDVKTLSLIHTLRAMDFSIKDIKGLLSHPQSAHIYLHKQIEALHHEQGRLNEKIAALRSLQDKLQMPIVTADNLAEKLGEVSLAARSEKNLQDKQSDARLVSLYIWGSFLQNITMTEYRRDLWEKVLAATSRSGDPNLEIMKKYLYSLPPERIDEDFAERNRHIEKIIAMDEAQTKAYARSAITQIPAMLADRDFIGRWKAYYQTRTLPTTALSDSQEGAMVRELSPRFQTYYENIHTFCTLVYDYLHSPAGAADYAMLKRSLGNYFDIEGYHNGVLAGFFSLYENYS